MKKYYKIIQELETIADIQLQIQDIVKQADVVDNQLVDIETILLQAGKTYKIQVEGDIYSILEELCNIIYGDIKRHVYYIQVLLADKLNQCKKEELKQSVNMSNHYKKFYYTNTS